MGVFAARWVEPLAKVLRNLGSKHVLVVNAEDGLDELSIAAPSHVAELLDGQVHTYTFNPEDAGIKRQPLDTIRVDGPEQSAEMIRLVLAGQEGPAADMVALNAGAALYAADVASSMLEGVELAREALANGSAQRTLQRLAELSA
jgi:anthranilate phosphoribosyltransferase